MADLLGPTGRPAQPGGNPIAVLIEAENAQTQVLVQGFNGIIRLLDGMRRHVYSLQYVSDKHGPGFITYCYGCSENAQAPVFPCQVNSEDDMPRPPAAFAVEERPQPVDPTV